MNHLTEHGHRLVCDYTPEIPTITVEDYCKWYTLYVVFPDNRVESLCFPGHDTLDDLPSGEMSFVDHVPNPRAVKRMAERLGYEIDYDSLERMVGRWFLEVQNWS
jgi:hypothetical protein